MFDGQIPVASVDFADTLSDLIIINFYGQYSNQFSLYKLKESLYMANTYHYTNITFGVYEIDNWRQIGY